MPFLLFDGNAEEAVNFYVSVFKDAQITEISRNAEGAPMPAGTAMVASFRLFAQDFAALNGGPEFAFNRAISYMINGKVQDEIAYYREKLKVDRGEPGPCGRLKDKYGRSWQVTPSNLAELLQDDDPGKATRAMQAMMQMSKPDIDALKRAHDEA